MFLDPKHSNRYQLIKFHKCRWDCPAQALYRINKVAVEALRYEVELCTEWCNDAQHNTMRKRAWRNGVGYMSFTIIGRRDRLVIASSKALPQSQPRDAIKLLQSMIPELVDVGIVRLSKSELWRADTKGYQRIAYTRKTDTKEVEAHLRDAGFINGYILVDRPLEYHIEALNLRLADTINLG